MRKILLMVLFLAAPLSAQEAKGGFFSLDPSWMPPTKSHVATQVGHGLITGLAAGVGAFVAGESGAKWAAAAVVGYYLVREFKAHLFYNKADLTDQERSKAKWDSKMDVAYPVAVAIVPWTWEWKEKAWPWWILEIGTTVAVGYMTDPGGYYSGMK